VLGSLAPTKSEERRGENEGRITKNEKELKKKKKRIGRRWVVN
jgi:hypothetical protein